MMDEPDYSMWDDLDCGPASKPYWRCEECGHEDHKKPMPVDRAKFYSKESPKCPRCKSQTFVPVGY